MLFKLIVFEKKKKIDSLFPMGKKSRKFRKTVGTRLEITIYTPRSKSIFLMI